MQNAAICFKIDAELLNLAGCTLNEMDGVLEALGFQCVQKDGGKVYKLALRSANRKRRRGTAQKSRSGIKSKTSPFAILRDLSVGP